jgi:hypothetical protein
MIDTLIAFGCSNTYGAEAIRDDDHNNEENINSSYAKYLSDHLKCKNYINLAECGISNFVISSKVISLLPQYIEKYGRENIFVVIGWTDNNRIRLYLNNIIPFKEVYREIVDAGEWPLICMLMPESVNNRTDKDLTKKFYELFKKFPFIDKFFMGILKYIFRTPSFYYTNICVKMATEYYLNKYNIKYFTFPTLRSHPIHYKDLIFKDPNLDKFFIDAEFLLDEKHNIYENNKDGSCNFDMLKKFGEFGKSNSGGHLKASAHKKLAKYLFDEICSRNIL